MRRLFILLLVSISCTTAGTKDDLGYGNIKLTVIRPEGTQSQPMLISNKIHVDVKSVYTDSIYATLDFQGDTTNVYGPHVIRVKEGKYDIIIELSFDTYRTYKGEKKGMDIFPDSTIESTIELKRNNLPPLKPFDPRPYDREEYVSPNVRLQWSCSDPDGEVPTYDVYLSTESNPAIYTRNLATSAMTLDFPLQKETQYYWKVVAFDAVGHKTEGPIWQFRTSRGSNTCPQEPVIINPINGAKNEPFDLLELQWDCVDVDGDPLTYYIELNDVVIARNVVAKSYILKDLIPEKSYKWMVFASDEACTTHSINAEFTTRPLLLPILSVSPETLRIDAEQGDVGDGRIFIQNKGRSDLVISSIENNVNYLTISPTSLTLAENERKPITIEADARNLGLGEYKSIIWINSNDETNTPHPVGIILNVFVKPDPPVNKFPANGDTIRRSSIMLCWSGSISDPNSILRYDLIVYSQSPTDTFTYNDLTVTSHKLENLRQEQKIRWKVIAKAGFYSMTGPEWSFSIVKPPYEMLFASNRNADSLNIYIYRSGEYIQLTDHPKTEYQPSWSHDGKYILYVSQEEDDDYEIWRMNKEGQDKQRLTRHPGRDEYPTYSPDDKWVVYHTFNVNTGTWEIHKIRSAGFGDITIASSAGDEKYPTWSPDGNKIAFVSTRDVGEYSIYTINADGTNPEKLYSSTNVIKDLAWRPSGGVIAFAEFGTTIDIYQVNVTTKAVNGLVVRSNGNQFYPSWDPFNEYMYFVDDKNGHTDLYRLVMVSNVIQALIEINRSNELIYQSCMWDEWEIQNRIPPECPPDR